MSEQNKTISFNLSKINWQIAALLIIAVIAAFQTFQLVRLRGRVSLSPSSASSSAPAASPSGLESMVGGC